jgi:hypothetical protein
MVALLVQLAVQPELQELNPLVVAVDHTEETLAQVAQVKLLLLYSQLKEKSWHTNVYWIALQK